MIKYFRRLIKNQLFKNSPDYWEQRYVQGGNSGTGSYGKFAEFKADIINNFISENHIQSVIEFGCGDGNQLSMINYPDYTGLDVSPTAIQICKKRFAGQSSKKFFVYDPDDLKTQNFRSKFDLALSLDVIFHLVEDSVFERYMQHLFDSASKYIIIYSSNTDENDLIRPAHYKNRCFSDWIESNRLNWRLFRHIPNKYPYQKDSSSGSTADFYIYTCLQSS